MSLREGLADFDSLVFARGQVRLCTTGKSGNGLAESFGGLDH